MGGNARRALEAIRRSQAALSTLLSSQPQSSPSRMLLAGSIARLTEAADELRGLVREQRASTIQQRLSEETEA